MSVSESLGRLISPISRARGASYFRSGAVRSLSVENRIIEAQVRGTSWYTVWIETGHPLLRASCNCPYFIGHADICKHIFAVILAAEAQSIPLAPPGVDAGRLGIEAQIPDNDWRRTDGQDDDDEDWRLIPSSPRAAKRQKPATPPPCPTPAWKQLLTGVSAEAQTPPPEPSKTASGQLLFVVDAATSVRHDALALELMTRDRKANGEWGKPRPARVTGSDLQNLEDGDERAILERLAGPRPYSSWYGGWDGYGWELSQLDLNGVLALDIIPLLCATGRCMLRPLSPGDQPAPRATAGSEARRPRRAAIGSAGAASEGGTRKAPGRTSQAPLVPVAWDPGPPWIFTIAIHVDDDSSYAIEGWLARGGERMPLDEPALILADGILFTHTHAARVNAGESFAWLAALHRAGRIVIPREGREELVHALIATSPQLADVPDDLRFEVGRSRPGEIDCTPSSPSTTKGPECRPARRNVSFAPETSAPSAVHSPRSAARSRCSVSAAVRRAGARNPEAACYRRL